MRTRNMGTGYAVMGGQATPVKMGTGYAIPNFPKLIVVGSLLRT
jgi:hypothetical protein